MAGIDVYSAVSVEQRKFPTLSHRFKHVLSKRVIIRNANINKVTCAFNGVQNAVRNDPLKPI